MNRGYTVTLLPEAVADLQRLEDFAIERALDALREGMWLLSWSPHT